MTLVRPWLPFAFCSFLVFQYISGPHTVDSWFYIAIWLPMCFFFVGTVMYLMQKQIQTLQAELRELKKSRP